MKRAVVFDLDGTLLDTLTDLANAVNYTLERHNFPTHKISVYRALLGNGASNLISRAVPLEYRDNQAVLQCLLQTFLPYYAETSRRFTRPYEGILLLLQRLRSVGIRTAVLSNKSHQNVPHLMNHYFPGLIDLAYGLREGIPAKPDPQGLMEILRELKVSPGDCLYVGDSEVDILTGRAAGVDTVAVSWGFRTKEDLLLDAPLMIVDKVEELAAILIDNPHNLGYTFE